MADQPIPTEVASAAGISRREALAIGAAGAASMAGLMPSRAIAGPQSPGGANIMETCCPIVELRQYTLHPGTKDTFRSLFESRFIEPQEAVGIKVIGQFDDEDDPDRFVWLRGFADMDARLKGLSAFYDGDLWHSYRNDANACINDSDNVLLMRSVSPDSGFAASRLAHRPALGGHAPHGRLMGFIHYVDADTLDAFADFFAAKIEPSLSGLGLAPIAKFRSGAGTNNFTRLPVRANDHVFAWFAIAADRPGTEHAYRAFMLGQHRWREGAPDPILHQLARKAEILRLSPMPRSALRALAAG